MTLQGLPCNCSVGCSRQLLSLLGLFTAAFFPGGQSMTCLSKPRTSQVGQLELASVQLVLCTFCLHWAIASEPQCTLSSVDLPWLLKSISCRRCWWLSNGSWKLRPCALQKVIPKVLEATSHIKAVADSQLACLWIKTPLTGLHLITPCYTSLINKHGITES